MWMWEYTHPLIQVHKSRPLKMRQSMQFSPLIQIEIVDIIMKLHGYMTAGHCEHSGGGYFFGTEQCWSK